jgi:hypothetical protein
VQLRTGTVKPFAPSPLSIIAPWLREASSRTLRA